MATPKLCFLLLMLTISQGGGSEAELRQLKKYSRTWTDQETKRTLKGAITDKHRDGSKIEILKEDGGHVWLVIERLIAADQKIANRWVEPDDAISLTNKMTKKGGERVVKVHADAGTHELSVVVKTPTKTIKKKVKAGKTLDFEVTVYKGYSVSGYHGGFLVDRETALKKTGLQIK
jgi:hypothetical protein